MQFSDTTNKTGIVEQVRSMTKLDSTQLPTWKIVNSVNNWLDFIAGYMIGNDRRFQWDDTNHTKLPEGTATLTSGQSDYAFLTDEQGNKILTLLGISILRNGYYQPMELVNRDEIQTSHFGMVTGDPTQYDKIADNVVRFDYKPSSTISSGLKFYFQRTPSYFTASNTTKEPGVSPLLHRGFVIAAAYDAALSEGLANLQPLSLERELEISKIEEMFPTRNNDDLPKQILPSITPFV